MDRDKSLLDPGQSEEAVCNFAASREILALIQYLKVYLVRPLPCHLLCILWLYHFAT